jgi:hypothetical protein
MHVLLQGTLRIYALLDGISADGNMGLLERQPRRPQGSLEVMQSSVPELVLTSPAMPVNP